MLAAEIVSLVLALCCGDEGASTRPAVDLVDEAPVVCNLPLSRCDLSSLDGESAPLLQELPPLRHVSPPSPQVPTFPTDRDWQRPLP